LALAVCKFVSIRRDKQASSPCAFWKVDPRPVKTTNESARIKFLEGTAPLAAIAMKAGYRQGVRQPSMNSIGSGFEKGHRHWRAGTRTIDRAIMHTAPLWRPVRKPQAFGRIRSP
jgi:hypothetical protein